MTEEKIIIQAKRKKQLKKLMPLLSGMGFNKVDLSRDSITVEKAAGEGLQGKTTLDYRIIFGKDKIEMTYSLPEKAGKRDRALRMLILLMNSLVIVDEYYDLKAGSLFKQINDTLSDLSKVVNRDAIDLSSELEGLKVKYDDQSKRYSELVTSSEENARILLECERRRDELDVRVRALEKLGDESLKEELYKWIRMHGGSIDLAEFCKSYSLPMRRGEEGLEMLIRDGYLKKRVEE